MTKEQIKKANELSTEIKELDCFIHSLGCCWKGEIEVSKRKWLLSNVPYGVFGKRTLECNSTLKNRIHDVLIEYRSELEKELQSL